MVYKVFIVLVSQIITVRVIKENKYIYCNQELVKNRFLINFLVFIGFLYYKENKDAITKCNLLPETTLDPNNLQPEIVLTYMKKNIIVKLIHSSFRSKCKMHLKQSYTVQ